jgi:hypothetical protein
MAAPINRLPIGKLVFVPDKNFFATHWQGLNVI